MKIALSEVIEESRSLNSNIMIEGEKYSLTWDLGGDMVWQKHERGLNRCTSSYPCFKCRIKKDDFYKENHIQLNQSKNNYMRTLDESKEIDSS